MMPVIIMSANHTEPRDLRLLGRWFRPFPGLGVSVSIGAVWCLTGIASSSLLPLLRYDRSQLAAGEWWRLLSAHFVHIDLRHGALNAAALILTASIVAGRIRRSEWLWLALGSVAAVDGGLYWLSPEISWYAGASGVLHGLLAGGGLMLVARSHDLIGAVILILVSGKLAFEHLSGGISIFMGDAGFMVVSESHLLGAIGGVAGALAVLSGAAARRKV